MPRLRRTVLTLVVALALLAGGLAVFQDQLIYFPEKLLPAAAVADAAQRGLSPWPDAENYRGLRREAEGAARATLLLFHGNAGHAGQRAFYADALAGIGLRVILAEYPAYGARAGALGEAALVADAAATIALVRRQFSEPLILAGESLGAGVAAATATASEAAALLLITPWDTLASVAQHHYPVLPVAWLLHDRYDSVASLAAYRGRVAVVIAERDRIVPAQFGRRLFDSLAEPRRLLSVAGADHNDWPGGVDDAWWQSLAGFLAGP